MGDCVHVYGVLLVGVSLKSVGWLMLCVLYPTQCEIQIFFNPGEKNKKTQILQKHSILKKQYFTFSSFDIVLLN